MVSKKGIDDIMQFYFPDDYYAHLRKPVVERLYKYFLQQRVNEFLLMELKRGKKAIKISGNTIQDLLEKQRNKYPDWIIVNIF